MPVLPEVASMMTLFGVSLPDASPSRIIRAAARSFTDPPGFCHSAFAYNSTPGFSRSNWCRRTRGVLPIMSRTDEPGARLSTDAVSVEVMSISDRTSPDFINVSNPVKLARIRVARIPRHDPGHDHPARRMVVPLPDVAAASGGHRYSDAPDRRSAPVDGPGGLGDR